MKREFTGNILFLVMINLLIKPFYSLVVDTTVQNRIGPEEYGLFLALFNFVYIQQIFADLGLQNYNNRNISQNPEKLPNLFPKILGAKLIFSLAFIGIVCLTAWIFNYSEFIKTYLVWIIGTQFCLSMILYLRTNISGLGKYYTDSCFSVLDKIILIGILSYILWFSNGGLEISLSLFIKSQFISMAITTVVVFIYSFSQILKPGITFDLKFIMHLLKKTLPYASLILLMAGYTRLDGIMLERLISDQALEAGKYASSFRLYDTFNNFTFLFAVLLLPMFSRMIGNGKALDELEKWALSLLSLGSILIIPLAIFQAPEILNIFYTREMDRSYTDSFIYLMFAGLPLSLNYIYGTLLTANGNLKLLNIIALAGFVFNFLMNFWIIPIHGAMGAALTTFITQGIVLIMQIFYAYRILSLKIDGRLILKLIIISAIAIFSTFLIFDSRDLSLLTGIIIYLFIFTIFTFLLKLISWSDMRILTKR